MCVCVCVCMALLAVEFIRVFLDGGGLDVLLRERGKGFAFLFFVFSYDV